MAVYKVSADVSEKEKAVGGVMTFGQAGWLGFGAAVFGVLFLLFYKVLLLPPIFALIISFPPGLVIGCMFAFYKKEQLPFCTYLIYKHNFKSKTKQLVNDLNYGKHFSKSDELFQ